MRSRRLVNALYLLLGTWLSAAAIRGAFFEHGTVGPVFDRFIHDAALVLAASLCVVGAARRRGPQRAGWALIAAGIAAWTAGEIYYTARLWNAATIPIPSPADVGYLLAPPLLLLGVICLARHRIGVLTSFAKADAAVAGLTIAAFSAALVLGTVTQTVSGHPLEIAVNLAYPVADLILAGVLVGAVAASGWQIDRTWMLLALGIVMFWFSDSMYLVRTARDSFVSDTMLDVGWWAGLTVMSLAAWQPHSTMQPASEPRLRLIVMPLLFAAASLGLLAFATQRHVNGLALVLALGALLAVMGRLVASFRFNAQLLANTQREALTDPLTGLANRRALTGDLQALLTQQTAAPHALVLFDLNGFKAYNDAFGHPAGDALLARLGERLAAYVQGRGTAYRMGGDEFCALLATEGETAELLVVGAAGALSEHGDGFSVTSAYGTIVLPLEADSAHDALQLADQRMYSNKGGSSRASAGRQSTDVLLRALVERNPGLSEHLTSVAVIAELLARELSLTDDAREQLRIAAELHDIGKVAVPDEILNKPGALDGPEWEFIYNHTLIGERIIAAAPALRGVAAIVRSTHERWDGSGYPDALSGGRIPVAARIIAVADAYDAMTRTRPHRAAMSERVAIAELRRHAGSQFDPAIVEAFTHVAAHISTSHARARGLGEATAVDSARRTALARNDLPRYRQPAHRVWWTGSLIANACAASAASSPRRAASAKRSDRTATSTTSR